MVEIRLYNLTGCLVERGVEVCWQPGLYRISTNNLLRTAEWNAHIAIDQISEFL